MPSVKDRGSVCLLYCLDFGQVIESAVGGFLAIRVRARVTVMLMILLRIGIRLGLGCRGGGWLNYNHTRQESL